MIDKSIDAQRIDSFQRLPTADELKKQAIEHKFY